MSDWPDDLLERHRAASRLFAERVRGVGDWSAPAPPEGWAARDVVHHLLEWLPGFLAGQVGVELAPVEPAGDEDLVAAWDRRCADLERLLAEQGGTAYESRMFGPMTLTELVDRFYTSDVVMHTWDLARASDQDDRLPPGFCEQALAGMEPMADVLASSGQFGPRVAVPADADVQDRLIGLIGRDPSWRPPG